MGLRRFALFTFFASAALIAGGCQCGPGPGAGKKLAFTVQPPSTSAAGSALAPAIEVAVQDADGNVVKSSATVTLALSGGGAGATLGGTASVAAVDGVARFSDLSVARAGAGYTLTATAEGLDQAVSDPFAISAGAGTRLAFLTEPSDAIAGGVLPEVKVAVQDDFANTLSASRANLTVALGSNPTGATLSGTTMAVATTGTASFTELSIDLVGDYTLTVSATGLATATSRSFKVRPGPPNTLAFTVQPSNATAGTAIAPAIQVTIRDARGNTVTSSSDPVTLALASNPSGGTLGGTRTVNAVGGVATFSDISINRVGTGYTLSATSPAVPPSGAATSAAFNVAAGPATALAFTVQPSDAVAGTALSPAVEVQIQDAGGNLVPSTASITVALASNPGSGTLAGTRTVAAVGGMARFTDLSIEKAASGYTLSATSTGLTSATSSAFAIRAGAAAGLAFVVQPSNTVAGVAIAPAVEVAIQDVFGNTVTTSTASVTVAIGTNPRGATLGGTTTQTAVNGIALFGDLTIQEAASGYTLMASSGGLGTAPSSAFNVTAAAAAKLVFQSQPRSGQAAGTALTPPVAVLVADAYGNPVTSSTASVTVALATNPGSGTLSGTTTVSASGGTALFTDLSIDKAATGYQLSASSSGLTGATSALFDIVPGPASRLSFRTQPSNSDAGSAISPAVQVQLVDAFGNVSNSTANVTMALANNPSGATLGGTTTVAAVAGIATFANLSVSAAGTGYTLSAASGTLPSVTSAAFDVRASPAAKLAITVQPTTTVAGAAITPAVRVAVQDALGNTVTNSTASVTLALGTNPAGGTLSGTTTVAAVSGIATFSNLSIDKAGAGYTLVATSGTLTSATSTAFNITVGPASRLSFAAQPTSTSAGTAIAPAVRVAIEDAFGNLVITSTASVTVAIGTNPSGGTLSGTTTATAIAGVASFANLSIDKAGTGYTLAATSGTLTGATSNGFDIAPGTASRLAFRTQPPGGTAGQAMSPATEVVIQDAFGNTVTSSTRQISVALGTNPGGSTLSGTTTVSAVAGVATFADLSLNKAATGYTLVASAAGAPALTPATSGAFSIVAGAPAALAFSVQPSNTTAGAAISPAVQVSIVDTLGNRTSATGAITVALGSNPGGATLGGTLTVNAVSGAASFGDLTLQKTGTGYTLTATSTGLTSTTSAAFNITPAADASLAFAVQPSNTTAGTPISPAVQVSIQDAFGNRTNSTSNVTVALGTNPSGGTLSGTTTVAAVAGVATFSSLAIDKAGVGYTLRATSGTLAAATSSNFDITAGAAARLAFSVQPTNATAGAAISPAVQVEIQDAGGNRVTSSTASVTVAIGTNPSGGALSGTTTMSAVAGVATFSNLSINKAGTGYTLAAASAPLAGAVSSAFNVSAGTAAALAFTVQPATTVVNRPITPAPAVSIVDAFGNVTSSTASVTVAIGANPSGGTLSGTLTVAAVAGVATFSNLAINTAGNGYTLTAAATGLTGATSNPFNILGAGGLVYTNPTVTGKIRLVVNPASTPTTVVLDLVAAVPLTGYQVGFNLPLDTSKVQANTTLLTRGTALSAGTAAPFAAAAALPATGPLAGVLASGQSQKASGAGAITTDTAVPAGAVFYTLRLDLKTGATPGVVFDGTALGARFIGLMRTKAGTDVVIPSEFAIGKLEVL